MEIRDIMTTDVEVIRPEDTIAHAAQRMRRLDVGSLPVCDGERLIGMVTDRDITVRATAEGREPQTTYIRDVMSPHLIYCFEDQESEAIEHIMQEHQIRRLPVLTRAKRLCGIISLGDLAVKSGQVQEVGRTIREISEPAMHA